MLLSSSFYFELSFLFKLGRKLQLPVHQTNKPKNVCYHLTGVWVIMFSICEIIHDILRFLKKCAKSEHKTLNTLFIKV